MSFHLCHVRTVKEENIFNSVIIIVVVVIFLRLPVCTKFNRNRPTESASDRALSWGQKTHALGLPMETYVGVPIPP